MEKREKRQNTSIVLLAYFHRCGWMVLMLVFMLFASIKRVLGVSCAVFSLWTFLGWRLRWKHIYCSYQSLSHVPMTPDNICWDTVRKPVIYGICAIFMVMGVVLLLI